MKQITPTAMSRATAMANDFAVATIAAASVVQSRQQRASAVGVRLQLATDLPAQRAMRPGARTRQKVELCPGCVPDTTAASR